VTHSYSLSTDEPLKVTGAKVVWPPVVTAAGIDIDLELSRTLTVAEWTILNPEGRHGVHGVKIEWHQHQAKLTAHGANAEILAVYASNIVRAVKAVAEDGAKLAANIESTNEALAAINFGG
jgi:hypothetical protein